MQWIAVYNDGTALPQFSIDENKNIVENKYLDIDRSKLSIFCLIDDSDPDPAKAKIKVQLHLTPEKHLIYRKRTFKTMRTNGNIMVDENGAAVTEDHVIYLVGYKIGDEEPVILYYYPEEDKIELDGARNNLELLIHEIR